ncbi:unnamed protein product [Paramecium sonneborni]|uniref:Transmembrane protein n=1 Tax=Paramecium sonneborni TaxID=65129 RepID=A0A8S1LG56_9CILI|nr:unnamed protein product [Paramecium sonneborni]
MSRLQKQQLEQKEQKFIYELLPNKYYNQQKTCWAIAIDDDTKFLVARWRYKENSNNLKTSSLDYYSQFFKIDVFYHFWIKLYIIMVLNFIIQSQIYVQIERAFLKHIMSDSQLFQSSINNQWFQGQYHKILVSIVLTMEMLINYNRSFQYCFWIIIKQRSQYFNFLWRRSSDSNHNKYTQIQMECYLKNIRIWNTFAFQPWQASYLELYSYDSTKGQYLKINEFPISGQTQFCTFLFPCIFVPSKLIFLSKNGYNLNLIQLQINSSKFDGHLMQAIDFQFPNNWLGNIFGTMNQNGEFLITWDNNIKRLIYSKEQKIKKAIAIYIDYFYYIEKQYINSFIFSQFVKKINLLSFITISTLNTLFLLNKLPFSLLNQQQKYYRYIFQVNLILVEKLKYEQQIIELFQFLINMTKKQLLIKNIIWKLQDILLFQYNEEI